MSDASPATLPVTPAPNPASTNQSQSRPFNAGPHSAHGVMRRPLTLMLEASDRAACHVDGSVRTCYTYVQYPFPVYREQVGGDCAWKARPYARRDSPSVTATSPLSTTLTSR